MRKNVKVNNLISSLNDHSEQVTKNYFTTKNSQTPYSASKKVAIVSISHGKHKKTISEVGSVERSSKINSYDKDNSKNS